MRIGYMTSKALLLRLNAIGKYATPKSHEKLLIFYYGLKACQLDSIAAAAGDILGDIGIEVGGEDGADGKRARKSGSDSDSDSSNTDDNNEQDEEEEEENPYIRNVSRRLTENGDVFASEREQEVNAE
eukprot:gene46365-57814_t